jgi:hypothetical protein
MPKNTAEATRLLRGITDFYLKSHDFNGIPVKQLIGEVQGSTLGSIRALVRRGLVEVYSSEYFVNPHVKRLPGVPDIESQVKALEGIDIHQICAYPSIKHMRRILPGRVHRSKPFTRFLALGHAQLEPIFFQLAVLGRYQTDPRYYFRFDGLNGHISVKESHYRKREMGKADKVMLETFGLGTDAKVHRVIVSFPRYLASLSSRHQQHWQSYRVVGKCKMERNYALRGWHGEWTDGISIYEALLEEISHINKMCQMIGFPDLFRRDYSANAREYEAGGLLEEPKGFGLLMVPTKKHYLDFAALLDKIISENLNADFFGAQGLSLEEQIVKNGQTVAVKKGTLRLLEEWITEKIRMNAEDGPAAVVKPLKNVRKLRQGPAHKLVQDEFSIKYQTDKEKLILDVYISISNIRMFFQTHPKAQAYQFPNHLKPENVVVF